MNNTFSFHRLGLLIRKQWYDNARLYLLSSLALFGVMALVFFLWVISDENPFQPYHEENTFIIYIIGLYITGLIFSGLTFSQLSDKAKGIYWLSIPATHLEKLLCGIFYSTVLFTLVYTTCFYIIQPLTLWFIELLGKEVVRLERYPNFLLQSFYVYFSCQALFMLGSVYFGRHAIIKTILASLLFFTAVSLFMHGVNRLFFPGEGVRWMDFVTLQDQTKNPVQVYALPYYLHDFLINFIRYGFAPVFLVVTYFRLKEKEI